MEILFSVCIILLSLIGGLLLGEICMMILQWLWKRDFKYVFWLGILLIVIALLYSIAYWRLNINI